MNDIKLEHEFALVWEAPPYLRMLVERDAGRVIRANGAMMALLASDEAFASARLLDLFTSAAEPAIREIAQQLAHGRAPTPLQVQLRSRPQRIRFNIHTLPRSPNLCLWQGVAVEAPSQSMAERSSPSTVHPGANSAGGVAAEQLDLGRILAVLAHDLQQPVRVIASYSQLLQQRLEGQLNEVCDRYLSHISDAAQRIQTQAGGLLALSHVSRGHPRASVDLNGILKAVRYNLERPLAEARAVLVHDRLPTVRGDSNQLLRLWTQLIDNAVRFRGQQPLRIEVEATLQRARWHFSVRDNGIGFRSAESQRIFEIFHRLPCPQNADRPGVGLTIARQVVLAHGGHIWAEGAPGQGATFHFDLPPESDQERNRAAGAGKHEANAQTQPDPSAAMHGRASKPLP